MIMSARPMLAVAACCVPLLACPAAWGTPEAAARAPARDPMLAPADARSAPGAASAAAPAAELPQARHLMVIDGRRFVVWGGRKRGVGEMLGDARIERIEDSAIVVRLDGTLQRLPLYGDVTRRPAIESTAPLKPPSGAGALPRPARPTEAVSLARPERPTPPGGRPDSRSEPRPDFPTRAGDPQ
jgi:hypothetical protein